MEDIQRRINEFKKLSQEIEDKVQEAKSINDRFLDLAREAEKLGRHQAMPFVKQKRGLSKDRVADARLTCKRWLDLPSHIKLNIESLEKRLAEHQKQKDKEKQALEEKQNNDKYLGEAIQYLLDHGKVVNQDFTINDAINSANYVAFEIEHQRRIAEMNGALIGFSGMNCDNCEGWDGTSRRCSCGNRRVSWEKGFGADFKNMYIHGEAW